MAPAAPRPPTPPASPPRRYTAVPLERGLLAFPAFSIAARRYGSKLADPAVDRHLLAV